MADTIPNGDTAFSRVLPLFASLFSEVWLCYSFRKLQRKFSRGCYLRLINSSIESAKFSESLFSQIKVLSFCLLLSKSLTSHNLQKWSQLLSHRMPLLDCQGSKRRLLRLSTLIPVDGP